MEISGWKRIAGQPVLQGVPLKLPPPKFLSTRSHVNWPKISLSARGYIGILYLENLGGGATLADHPVGCCHIEECVNS